MIHAVGPVWRGGDEGEEELLASAYRASLRLADEHALRTIAFPSISTGVYGFPMERAARIALGTVTAHLRGETSLREATFVLFGRAAYDAFAAALAELGGR